jgi:hypothetical protein
MDEIDNDDENDDESDEDCIVDEDKDDDDDTLVLLDIFVIPVIEGRFGSGAINVLVTRDQWLWMGIMAIATTNASVMINNHDTPGMR